MRSITSWRSPKAKVSAAVRSSCHPCTARSASTVSVMTSGLPLPVVDHHDLALDESGDRRLAAEAALDHDRDHVAVAEAVGQHRERHLAGPAAPPLRRAAAMPSPWGSMTTGPGGPYCPPKGTTPPGGGHPGTRRRPRWHRVAGGRTGGNPGRGPAGEAGGAALEAAHCTRDGSRGGARNP